MVYGLVNFRVEDSFLRTDLINYAIFVPDPNFTSMSYLWHHAKREGIRHRMKKKEKITGIILY